jgi:hypothetical protein
MHHEKQNVGCPRCCLKFKNLFTNAKSCDIMGASNKKCFYLTKIDVKRASVEKII